MAFQIYASVGDTTTQLNDEAPFCFESIEGLSSSNIIRHEQRGPLQSGATDLGYRLTARVFTLNLLFYASSDAILDGYRDTLIATFKPLEDISIFLTVKRDDDEIRKLTCHTVDEIAISLVPEHRPGHLHRATIKLRAANPLWKANAVTSGVSDFGGFSTWWLAGGAIDASLALEHLEFPSAGPDTPFAGTITGDWSVVVVTKRDTTDAANAHYIWQDGTGGSASFWRGAGTTGAIYSIVDSGALWSWPYVTDEYNVHVVESRSGTQYWRYWNGASLAVNAFTTDGTATFDYSLRGGSNFSWRTNRLNSAPDWQPDLRKAAIYQGVSTAQLTALVPYLMGSVNGTVTLVNDGDTYAFPVITLRGPMSNPVIVNATAGGTINLTGGTLGSGETWTIDLRNGDKRITDQSGANMLGSITSPMGLADFALAPAPIASGGTNVITVTPGTLIGSSTFFNVEITSQYMSF